MFTCCRCTKLNRSFYRPVYRNFAERAHSHADTMSGRMRAVWNGPNFKYWFLGTSFFVSWMSYYGMKTYKKSRICVRIAPLLPSHYLVSRVGELQRLKELLKESWFGAPKVKTLLVLGPPGSGKSVLVQDFVDGLLAADGKFSLPKSKVSVFLQSDCEESFLNSLKALAAKLKVKPADVSSMAAERLDTSFSLADFKSQCDVLFACIQESLEKHRGWVIVFDNMQSSTPASVTELLDDWFVRRSGDWSKGTVVFVCDAAHAHTLKIRDPQKIHKMQTGLSIDEAYQLLCHVTGLDKSTEISEGLTKTIDAVQGNPLAVLCVGILLRERLALKEVESIDGACEELISSLKHWTAKIKFDSELMREFYNTNSGESLLTIETVVAMTIKVLLKKNSYLNHGIDLMACMKPGAMLPQSVLNRHLSNGFYQLPLLTKASYGLTDVFNRQKAALDEKVAQADQLEVKGKAWSNKNLAEYLRRVKEFFMTGVNTVKQIYEIVYGELPVLPEKDDGLDMFRSCELILQSTIEPGGGKGVSLHPLVYNAARQHFLASTVYQMESKHVADHEAIYNNKPWYRKLSGFSEQASLCQHRTSAGELKHSSPGGPVSRYNFGVDVTELYREDWLPLEGYWNVGVQDLARYLQGHISRSMKTLEEEMQVCKQDAGGKASKKLLLAHLKYILQNHSLEFLGERCYSEALRTVAGYEAMINNDLDSSEQMLKRALALDSQDTLSVAKTLHEIAKIHHLRENYAEARKTLEEASEIYESHRRKCGEYQRPLEFGKLLGLLGVIYGALDMRLESKQTIERSLMLFQAAPPDLQDEAKSKQYGAEFASSLTDLGHAYVSMGLPLYGKKVLDLALAAHKNIHGSEEHPEVVRTMTVLGVAHLMQGHNEESRKLRHEAGKLQASIRALPMY